MSQGQAAEATCPGLAVCRAMLLREAVETLAAEVRRDRAVGAKRLAPTPQRWRRRITGDHPSASGACAAFCAAIRWPRPSSARTMRGARRGGVAAAEAN